LDSIEFCAASLNIKGNEIILMSKQKQMHHSKSYTKFRNRTVLGLRNIRCCHQPFQ